MVNTKSYSGYHQTFRVYPFACFKPELEYQGKIVMPPSALDLMSKLSLEYPLMFELTNHKNPSRKVHCGVLEFLAEEGKVYIPFWMMQNIGVEAGAFMKVSTVSLPLGSFVKIQPQSTAFLDISNPKAVLETTFKISQPLLLEKSLP
jgi:ubiquitin fusion degradation protein 1